jgi:alpha/beta superfamily hydrolase
MREEQISFTNSRGDVLSGVLHHPADAVRGAVILCHGMESNKKSEKIVRVAAALAGRGILALRFDFSYAGESSGKFEDITYTGEVDDLRAAYNVVQSRAPDKKIAILGSSMGGTVALLFAANQPAVAALVTVAAPVHPEKFPARTLTPKQIDEWRARGFTLYHGQRLNVSLLNDLEKINVVAAAARIACPVLIIHGDADEVVPVKEAYELDGCLTAPRKLSILPAGDHRMSDPALLERAMAEALDWLMKHVQ